MFRKSSRTKLSGSCRRTPSVAPKCLVQMRLSSGVQTATLPDACGRPPPSLWPRGAASLYSARTKDHRKFVQGGFDVARHCSFTSTAPGSRRLSRNSWTSSIRRTRTHSRRSPWARKPTSTRPSPRPSARLRPSASPAGRRGSRSCAGSSRSTRSAATTSLSPSRKEMGAPRGFALNDQVGIGLAHLEEMVGTLETFEFERMKKGHARRQGADRRRRHDHALELAAQPDHLQGRAGAGGGMHDGAEAERDRAARRHHFRRNSRRGGRAQGRLQPRQRRRADGRPGDRQPPRRRHGVVHRFDPRRHPRRQGRRRHRQARPPGARRQVGQHSVPRRRFRRRGEEGRRRMFRQQRPVLQRADPHVRAARPPGRGRRFRQEGRGKVPGRRGGRARARFSAPSSARRSSTRSRT